MIKVDGNKLITDTTVLEFDNKILEAVEYHNLYVVVFDTDFDNGFDNVYCYKENKELLWRISPASTFAGRARSTYVGVNLINDVCSVVDFFGRRFTIDMKNGNLLHMEIVK